MGFLEELDSLLTTSEAQAARKKRFELRQEKLNRVVTRDVDLDIRRLEAELRRAGIKRPLEDVEDLTFEDKALAFASKVAQKSGLLGVLDVISRPGHAVSDVIKGTVEGDITGGLKSAVGEFTSKPSRTTTDDIFNSLGVPRGSSLSSLIPSMFSKTGRGLRLKEEGMLDITPRGVLAFLGDVVTDPLTYLTFGTGATGRRAIKAGDHYLSRSGINKLRSEFKDAINRGLDDTSADLAARQAVSDLIEGGVKHFEDQGGIKMFGKTLVPSSSFEGPAKSVKDAVIRTLEKTSFGSKVIDVGDGLYEGLGSVFNRNWASRATKYPIDEQNFRDIRRARHHIAREETEKLIQGTTREERELIGEWIEFDHPDEWLLEHGGKNASELLDIGRAVAYINARFAKQEFDIDILDHIRTNYILHAYYDSPERVRKVFARISPSAFAPKGLHGSQLERILPTWKDAEKAGLHPVKDAGELLLRRWWRHEDAMLSHAFFEHVRGRYGSLPPKLDVGPALIQQGEELAKIAELINRGKVKVEEVRKLSDLGRREFLRQRFGKISNPNEMLAVARKYKEFESIFPFTTPDYLKNLESFYKEPMAEVADIKELRGVFLPAGIAKDIENYSRSFVSQRDVKRLLRYYDKLNNIFKWSVTLLYPSFHARNARSNLVQAFTDVGLSALNPVMHKDAMKIIAGLKGEFTSTLGRKWTYDRVRYEALQRGIAIDYRDIYETVGDVIPIRAAKGFGKRVLENLRHPVRTIGTGSQIIENEARLSLFVNYLRRGVDLDEAARRVKKVLFDYSNISSAEREVLARAFPFYRWMRKNMGLQVERLIRNPRQAVVQGHALKRVLADPTAVPKFLRGEATIVLDTDEQGNLTTVRGMGLPIEDLNQFFNQSVGQTLAHHLTQMSPLARIPLEIGMDKEFLTGRKISENSRLKWMGQFLDEYVRKVPGGKKVLEWLQFSKIQRPRGVIEYHMNPAAAYVLFKSYAITRAYQTADRYFDAVDRGDLDPNSLPGTVESRWMLDTITGLRLNDVSIGARIRNIKEWEKELLEKKALTMGIRRRLREDTYMPRGTRRIQEEKE